MENNIEDYMKIDSVEKSDEFYYDGVPQMVTSKNGEYIESTLDDSYKMAEPKGTAKSIRSSLNMMQVIFVLLGILLIMKGISNFINNKKIKDEDEYNDPINSGDDGKIRRKTVLMYFVFSGILFFGGLIIHIVKNYANNL